MSGGGYPLFTICEYSVTKGIEVGWQHQPTGRSVPMVLLKNSTHRATRAIQIHLTDSQEAVLGRYNRIVIRFGKLVQAGDLTVLEATETCTHVGKFIGLFQRGPYTGDYLDQYIPKHAQLLPPWTLPLSMPESATFSEAKTWVKQHSPDEFDPAKDMGYYVDEIFNPVFGKFPGVVAYPTDATSDMDFFATVGPQWFTWLRKKEFQDTVFYIWRKNALQKYTSKSRKVRKPRTAPASTASLAPMLAAAQEPDTIPVPRELLLSLLEDASLINASRIGRLLRANGIAV